MESVEARLGSYTGKIITGKMADLQTKNEKKREEMRLESRWTVGRWAIVVVG